MVLLHCIELYLGVPNILLNLIHINGIMGQNIRNTSYESYLSIKFLLGHSDVMNAPVQCVTDASHCLHFFYV